MRGSASKSFGIEVAALAGVPSEVIERAKKILKRLEKNDLTKTMLHRDENIEEVNCEVKERQELCDIEEIILATDINSLTPIDAFKMIIALKEKVIAENE